jgi:hypothetical protein
MLATLLFLVRPGFILDCKLTHRFARCAITYSSPLASKLTPTLHLHRRRRRVYTMSPMRVGCLGTRRDSFVGHADVSSIHIHPLAQLILIRCVRRPCTRRAGVFGTLIETQLAVQPRSIDRPRLNRRWVTRAYLCGHLRNPYTNGLVMVRIVAPCTPFFVVVFRHLIIVVIRLLHLM